MRVALAGLYSETVDFIRKWAMQRSGFANGSRVVASTGAASASSVPRINPRWTGQTIEECRDAKSLIGLMIFRDLRSSGDA